MLTAAEESKKRTLEARERIAKEQEAARKKEREETDALSERAKQDAVRILPEYKEKIHAAEKKGKCTTQILAGSYSGRFPDGSLKFVPFQAYAVRDLLAAEGYRVKVTEEYSDAIADEMPAMTHLRLTVSW